MSRLLKDIAVFFDDSDNGLGILRTAARLASEQSALLIGITTADRADAIPEDGFALGAAVGEVCHRLRASAERHLLNAKQNLASEAERFGIASECRAIPHTGSDAGMVLHSLYSDLLLIGHPDAPGAPFAWSSIKALQHTGVPILLVPASWGDRPVAHRITVAWNASRQARRAVADALPLLVAAQAVDLLIVDPEHTAQRHGEDPGVDMAAYLLRHGVQVNLRRASSKDRPVAEAIIAHAVEMDADLIVFGAYSRPRISEAVLGGVSRTLLAEVPLPLFVSH